MKKIYFVGIIIVLILAIIIGFKIFDKANDEKQKSQIPTLSKPVARPSNLEAQTNSEGPVTITIVPHQSESAGTWEFEITLDTHSVELNDDLTKAAVLIVDNESYYPIAWGGDLPGGHHRKGILQFAPISAEQKSITLKIRNIGGVEERNFTWQIK